MELLFAFLKRAIYTFRVVQAQARRFEEMQAVADALSLLAKIVMGLVGATSCRPS